MAHTSIELTMDHNFQAEATYTDPSLYNYSSQAPNTPISLRSNSRESVTPAPKTNSNHWPIYERSVQWAPPKSNFEARKSLPPKPVPVLQEERVKGQGPISLLVANMLGSEDYTSSDQELPETEAIWAEIKNCPLPLRVDPQLQNEKVMNGVKEPRYSLKKKKRPDLNAGLLRCICFCGVVTLTFLMLEGFILLNLLVRVNKLEKGRMAGSEPSS